MSRPATRASASSQVAGASSPSLPRTSGVVIRSGAVSTAAEVQPFWHSPPRLVGKSRGATVTVSDASTSSRIAHWSAQYGQCVSTAVVTGQTPTLPISDPRRR